ncbi:MAG: tetratricopeptide repeat protein [Acidobacteriota bacterium]
MKGFSISVVCCLLLTRAALAQGQAPVCHTQEATKSATRPAVLFEGAGKVHLEITTRSAEAQAFFDQGLALLHSFWGYEADRSFTRAAQLDPECAMAQWGIAMADVNEIKRNEAIKRAKELAANATDRERLYIVAVEARYDGERSSVQNNGFLGASDSYRGAMRKIVAAYPDDLEAKLFLALAEMSGYERDGTPRAGTMEAIALCQVVLYRDPNHLAAHHYLIHALESGKRPQDAVPHADKYPSLAPSVGHAVHMPGHIYVHVDRWEDAANAFERSAEVDRAYIRDQHETSDHAAGPYGHNVHFLTMVYGYQGRYRDALRVSRELVELGRDPKEAGSRAALEGRLGMLRTLVRFEKWGEILDGHTLADDGPFEVFAAWRYYARALAHLGRNDSSAARAELASLEREIAWMKDRLPKLTEAPQKGRQRQQLRALAVGPLEINARLLAREGKADEALKKVREGIEEEIKLGYSEPPLYPQPMEEVAGKVSLELKRWKEAEEFFRAAIERDPGSGRALFGLFEALQGAGKSTEARDVLDRFNRAWSKADSDLPEMRRARTLVARGSGQ